MYNTVGIYTMSPRRIAGLLACLSFLALFATRGQVALKPRPTSADPLDGSTPSSNLRIDSKLVLVPVSVYDSTNHPVTGLEKEHFKIFDDHVEQKVTHFAMDDEPVAVGLVLDTSGSMGPKLRRSRQAANMFFQTANPEDEFFLVEFNDQPKLVVPITTDTEQIENRLLFTASRGRTALLDAVMLSLHEVKKSAKKRKALLIISDGGDNCSRYSETEVRNLVRESDVLIYAIGVFEPYALRGRTPEESSGPGLLTDLAEQTGARHFPADTFELPDIAAKIGVEMRNRYVLGFSPTAMQRDGRYHRVQVKVVPPKGLPSLRASWRMGYYAPSE